MPFSRTESRVIEGRGTAERDWQAWEGLEALPFTHAVELVPPGRRLVVVAPHPDDELLGCGGLVAQLAQVDREIGIIGVTDGEASHPGSINVSPAQLLHTRSAERRAGLRDLGLSGESLQLGYADGGVAARETALASALYGLLRRRDVVITTWRLDGHPDHEAVGRAVYRATQEWGCTLIEMPVWMWHWAKPGDRRVPWQCMKRLELGESAHRRKRRAITAHTSQIEPDGSRAPVLPSWALARLLRPFEYFVVAP